MLGVLKIGMLSMGISMQKLLDGLFMQSQIDFGEDINVLIVKGIVEEGEQVTIRSLFWHTETQNLMQRELDSKMSVAVGDPLNWEVIDASRESLLSLGSKS